MATRVNPLTRSICGKCGVKRPDSVSHCRTCYAAKERKRYHLKKKSLALGERIRGRLESRRPVGKRRKMTSTQVACAHDKATKNTKYKLFHCADCDAWFDLDLEPVAAPAEISSPKGSARHEAGDKKRSTYRRDPRLMIEVACSSAGCKRTWAIWPQNEQPQMLCPQIHLPLHKMSQTRERQRRFRERMAAGG